jgi:DnaJ-class molecular chaperone
MNLESKDLYTTCQICNGTGKYNPPRQFSERLSIEHSSRKCDDCNGKGIKLTPTGLVIEDFIKRIL